MYNNNQASINLIRFNTAKSQLRLGNITRSQTNKYNELCIKGGKYGN